jgi:hypothetical protein
LQEIVKDSRPATRLDGTRLDESIEGAIASTPASTPELPEMLKKVYEKHYNKLTMHDAVLASDMGMENSLILAPRHNKLVMNRLAKAIALDNANGETGSESIIGYIDKVRAAMKATSATAIQVVFKMGVELGNQIKSSEISQNEDFRRLTKVVSLLNFTVSRLKNVSLAIAEVGVIAAAGVVDGVVASFIEQASTQQSSKGVIQELENDLEIAYKSSTDKLNKTNTVLADEKGGVAKELSMKPHRVIDKDKIFETQSKAVALQTSKDAVRFVDKVSSAAVAVQAITSKNVYRLAKAASSFFMQACSSRYKKAAKRQANFVSRHTLPKGGGTNER